MTLPSSRARGRRRQRPRHNGRDPVFVRIVEDYRAVKNGDDGAVVPRGRGAVDSCAAEGREDGEGIVDGAADAWMIFFGGSLRPLLDV